MPHFSLELKTASGLSNTAVGFYVRSSDKIIHAHTKTKTNTHFETSRVSNTPCHSVYRGFGCISALKSLI